jgi:hypothetical protein
MIDEVSLQYNKGGNMYERGEKRGWSGKSAIKEIYSIYKIVSCQLYRQISVTGIL